jgi:hypothetical protein
MLKVGLILALCLGLLCSTVEAKTKTNRKPASVENVSSDFIKARSNPPLVLSEKVLAKIHDFELHYNIIQVGSVVDLVMKTKDAMILGYVHMEGQSIDRLKAYPELVEYMKKKNWDHLPDSRLNLYSYLSQ